MLSNCHWTRLLCRLRDLEPSPKGRGHPTTYPTYLIAWLALWAAAYNWPLCELALQLERHGWPRVVRRCLPRPLRRRVPDMSTLSRRWRKAEFFTMLDRLLIRLAGSDITGLIDGMILPVGPHSTDAEARFGAAGSKFQKGYKAVRLTNRRGQAWAVRVVSANQPETKVALDLLEWVATEDLKLVRAIGDRAYDSEPLRAEFHRHLGALLLAPRQRRNFRNGRSRKSRMGRFRRQSMRILRSPWGRYWMNARSAIERSNGWLKQRPYLLGFLPPFIRTTARVRRWVVCMEILMSTAIGFRQKEAVA